MQVSQGRRSTNAREQMGDYPVSLSLLQGVTRGTRHRGQPHLDLCIGPHSTGVGEGLRIQGSRAVQLRCGAYLSRGSRKGAWRRVQWAAEEVAEGLLRLRHHILQHRCHKLSTAKKAGPGADTHEKKVCANTCCSALQQTGLRPTCCNPL